MAGGEYRSRDDWLRDALKSLVGHRQMVVYDEPQVLSGIRRGLDELQQGLGRPFEEFDAEFRTKQKLPDDA